MSKHDKRKRKKFSIGRLSIYLFLFIAAIVSLFPFYWMFVMATRPSAAYNSIPPTLTPGNMLVENFKKVLSQIDFFGGMWNSFILCLVVTIIVLLISSLAGFAFAKFRFPGRNIFFIAILVTMIIPPQLGLIPQYFLISKIGLLDTLQGVMIVSFLNPLGIFLMRQYISEGVPDELIEAAKLDGCSNFRIYWGIVLPIILPAFATLGIIVFTAVWGEFLWQFTVLRDPEMYTIQVALAQLGNTHNIDFGMILSGVFWATVPLLVIFLLFNRLFISSITEGSVK
ncbi:carbohydrate ABC transporter permease [Niallia circulans]|jgi:cellobiose transport system permease protein|uniref:Sugar ABC transporter permease n=1 Tax=Niallia circulans TaxID=1397 RepID=A0A0J1LC41_NIACI|nr:carbohydrate ABC transporter permease [Niallia circulans]KLV26490.1 sugar ABC transporter permease [Niallia circulans]MCM2980505.1 carbohydrate ABC transporter permease [Niallia circulans]MDR4317335.1 carbohydrate ABC transporter permease [Niallia circulans]MED3838827.1 carbohydrate ABC transporter permease [Niallia circulans]MED4245224.1 carbohydrate ABC transporter permease [Niallia circulans]